MEPSVAYLAAGRLFVKHPHRDAVEIESPFATAALERLSREQSTNGWKAQNGVWASSARARQGLQGPLDMLPGRRSSAFKAIVRGPSSSEIYYLLNLDGVTGLFRYDLKTGSETRLMHRNEFPAQHLAVANGCGVVISLHEADGSVTVAASDDEGRHWRALTGGDSVDESPVWIPGTKRIVYQSSGIARNELGLRIGQGPYVIESLDLDAANKVETVASQADHDLLLPRVSSDGSLYFVRRPYQRAVQASASILTILRDFFLFPFRLLRMIFDMLNFKSLIYSGRTLTSADPASLLERQQGHVRLWGQMVDAHRRAPATEADSAESLVPREWKLVRRSPDGSEQILAQSVLAYDLCADGSIVYTTGTGVYHATADGSATRMCRDAMIEAVVAL